MTWKPAAGCTVMRDQFNKRFPHRDKASDGILGDQNHASRFSYHNPDKNNIVHALDIDKGFGKKGDDDIFITQLLDFCLNKRPGSERILHVVFKDQVASGTYRDTMWVMRGSGYGHWEHIHFSFTTIGERDFSLFDIPILNNHIWDGITPIFDNVKTAQTKGTANLAAYRVACRLADKGFYTTDPEPIGVQGYPIKAVSAFQIANGGKGSGNYGRKTHGLLF